MFSIPAIFSLMFVLIGGLGFRAYTGRWELLAEDEVPENFDSKAYGKAMGIPLMTFAFIGIVSCILLLAEKYVSIYISFALLGFGIVVCFSWIYSIEKKFKIGRFTSKKQAVNHRRR